MCHRSLFYYFRGKPVVGQGKVCPGFLFHRRCKTTNLIDNEIRLTAETIFISKHSAILARGGNKQKVRHFRRDIIRSVLRIEITSSLFPQSAKRANEFTNRACMYIQLTCLTLSLNKKFEATLVHDIHCISVFTNQGLNHGKHRHRPKFHFSRCNRLLLLPVLIPFLQTMHTLLPSCSSPG